MTNDKYKTSERPKFVYCAVSFYIDNYCTRKFLDYYLSKNGNGKQKEIEVRRELFNQKRVSQVANL